VLRHRGANASLFKHKKRRKSRAGRFPQLAWVGKAILRFFFLLLDSASKFPGTFESSGFETATAAGGTRRPAQALPDLVEWPSGNRLSAPPRPFGGTNDCRAEKGDGAENLSRRRAWSFGPGGQMAERAPNQESSCRRSARGHGRRSGGALEGPEFEKTCHNPSRLAMGAPPGRGL